MPKHIVIMKCVGFVEVDNAENAEEAMQFAQNCKTERIKDISGFYPESAIAMDDLPQLETFVKKTQQKRRAVDRPVGRPRTTKDDIPKAFRTFYQDYKQKKISVTGLSRMFSLSRPTVYKYIRMLEGDEQND